MKQPNPNAGLNARKRRILRNLRSYAHASVHPIKSDRLVDDNDKSYSVLSYRTDIVAKDPEEKLLARLREFSFSQLLRRRTQGRNALSRAQANHARATTPAEKGSLWPQVTRCQKFLDAVETEIQWRGSEAEHLVRLAHLTPREIKHKLHHGHEAFERARRRGYCAPVALAIRTNEFNELHRRNVTLTTALRNRNAAESI